MSMSACSRAVWTRPAVARGFAAAAAPPPPPPPPPGRGSSSRTGNEARVVSAEEALQAVRSGHRVFVHTAAATPQHLLSKLVERAPELRDVELCHLHTEGDGPHLQPGMEQSFFVNNFFVGKNARAAVAEGRAAYLPAFLSDIPFLFSKRTLPLNVALMSVSPPDRHGIVSLGPSVDASSTALLHADVVIGQVNKHMPRTFGDGDFHVSRFDFLVEHDEPLHSIVSPPPSEVVQGIARNVSKLVRDGDCLQMGIGAISDATMSFVADRQNLGIHTEMFSNGVLELIKSGALTNACKTKHPGRTLTSFAVGSHELYDFIDDNPGFLFMRASYSNDPSVIKRNDNVVAINSAVEVDLTGQVCATSIGSRIISGVGGQLDFERAAALSKNGRPIIALPSRTSNGKPRIVPTLSEGAGVTTTRAHVHWVATENGYVNLHGLNIPQRARALIGLAHPDDREGLERWCREQLHLRYF